MNFGESFKISREERMKRMAKYTHIVKTRHNGKLYSLPINMNTFKEFYNIEHPEEITIEHLNNIYKELFYGYSEKQWGKPIDKIDKSVFNRLPIKHSFDNNYFNDTYQGIPEEGYTKFIEELLKDVKIVLNIKVNKESFDFSKYDIVYNTGPIDEFFNYELGKLEYRSLEFKTEKLNDTYQEYAVINEADIDVPYTRTIEHKHFNNKGQKHTFITKEYSVSFDGTNEPYYTVNTESNQILYSKYKNMAAEKFPNMIFCGRLGSYKYYDMDDAIEAALYNI